jgi:hypothetical protein
VSLGDAQFRKVEKYLDNRGHARVRELSDQVH